MRIALALHAFPPHATTGVETYGEALARALARLGHEVHVFAPRRDETRAQLALVREERDGYAVTWLALGRDPDDGPTRRARPGAAAAFGRFLDREQPEVVHVQHVLRLGAELVDEARARDLVTVFTAHDPFAALNDYCLVAPDLSALDPRDLVAQARCERARGVLDAAFAAHDGYLPPQERDATLRARVAAALTPRAEDRDDADLARRVARLRLSATRGSGALARCDRVEAPTRWLAELLFAAGLRAKIEVRACGHDVDALRALAPPTRARRTAARALPRRPVRGEGSARAARRGRGPRRRGRAHAARRAGHEPLRRAPRASRARGRRARSADRSRAPSCRRCSPPPTSSPCRRCGPRTRPS
ncbi:MAG: glycosyltransferase [Planctomycetes bacterium]|nr:glycosyltransferase [Planctomycetota bacterium]